MNFKQVPIAPQTVECSQRELRNNNKRWLPIFKHEFQLAIENERYSMYVYTTAQYLLCERHAESIDDGTSRGRSGCALDAKLDRLRDERRFV